MYLVKPENCGAIQEKEYGKWFTYHKTNNPWALSHGFEFEIDVLDGVRFCNIKKTVAYVSVDEDAEGNPVVKKWQLKKHEVYNGQS
jgi:hypothetical protein